jgi:S-adenosyl methyltransferase
MMIQTIPNMREMAAANRAFLSRAVRHFEMVATVMERMPSGSYLAVTHPTPDFNPEETAKAVAAASAAGVTLVPRTQAEVGEFFTGLELIDPGVTPGLSWRPDTPPGRPPGRLLLGRDRPQGLTGPGPAGLSGAGRRSRRP